MPLIPYQAFRLETALPPDEVAARLTAATEPVRWLRFRLLGSETGNRFEGTVGDDWFRVWRLVGYENSFLPVIRGRVTPSTRGSSVEGSLVLNPVMTVIVVILTALIALGGAQNIGPLLAGGPWNPPGWSQVLVIIFLWALCAGCFTYEARRSLALLHRVISAEPKPAASAA